LANASHRIRLFVGLGSPAKSYSLAMWSSFLQLRFSAFPAPTFSPRRHQVAESLVMIVALWRVTSKPAYFGRT